MVSFDSGQIWVTMEALKTAPICPAFPASNATCDKAETGDGVMAANKIAATNATRRGPARKSGAKRTGRRESWKKVFERNLIRVGYSPAEAKEIVVDFAAS